MSDAEIMAMSGMADAALQVAGNITASTFNYQHTKELAQWQNDMNVRNWQMANEYNSPINQMERFKAAGLNPNLMYGQGTPGNAGAVAAVNAGSHNEIKNPFDSVQLAGMYQQVKNAALQGQAQQLSNIERMITLHEKANTFNAWQQFAWDHRDKNSDTQAPNFYIGANGKYDFVSDPDNYYAQYIRNTPQYKKLELLWQKGELNESNIGLIDTKKNVLGFSEEKNILLRDVLQGDVDMKKLVTLLLLNLLESASSPGVMNKIF